MYEPVPEYPDANLTAVMSDPKAMIGASIPRSGHHFLASILSAYYGDQLFYCEQYTVKNCCSAVPCTRRGRHTITYRKSHDREFVLDQSVKDALYVIQHRHPVPEALSDRELEIRNAPGGSNSHYHSTPEHYSWWLAVKATYYRKFHDKWMSTRIPNAVYLDYDWLSAEPVSAISPILAWASGHIDEPRLLDTLRRATQRRVSGPAGKAVFKPRVVEDSPYFDAELLGAFESYILTRCPNFQYTRQLSGSFEGTPLYGLILLNDPDEPLPAGERDRSALATALAPHHPETSRRHIQKMIQTGKAEEAVGRAVDLLARHPFFRPGYRTLFTACRQAKTLAPLTAITQNARLACAGSANLLAELGAALAAYTLQSDALSVLSEAIAVDPECERAYRTICQILMEQRQWAEALSFAEKAAALQPENAGNINRLAKIRRHLQ